MKKQLNPTDYIVKITLYKGCRPDEVMYYNYAVPHQVFVRYKWYFEYLAALVKVANPKEKVELLMNQLGNDDPFLAGEWYIEKKTASLLKAKRSQLKGLCNKRFDDDLFSFKGQEVEEKKERLRGEIEALERGEFNYWYPPTYINKVKRFKGNRNR